MKNLSTTIIAAAFNIAALCWSGASFAQPVVSATRNPNFDQATTIERFSAIETDASTVATSPQLENGEVVNKRDFPGILSQEPDFNCTAALVGPSTVLTAAHCLNKTRNIELFFGSNGVKAKCFVAPEYATDVTVDLSLCVLEFEVIGLNYETVDQSAPPAAGTEVTLVGYGCQIMGGNRDGNLRIGTSMVVEAPATKVFDIPASWSAYIPTKSDINVPGNATLCPGDSGGPMYGGTSRDGRKIIGVNSRTTYGKGGDGVSLFSSVGTDEAKSFFNTFIKAYGASICGINRLAGCQQG